jgi:nicotinamide mononucleotide (NMN) deamidase PncC
VSEPVVRQMLSGALERSGADIGVAVSGVAGPDGGTEEKPVGTVWLAWGTADRDAYAKNPAPHRPRHVSKTGRGGGARFDSAAVIGATQTAPLL